MMYPLNVYKENITLKKFFLFRTFLIMMKGNTEELEVLNKDVSTEIEVLNSG